MHTNNPSLFFLRARRLGGWAAGRAFSILEINVGYSSKFST